METKTEEAFLKAVSELRKLEPNHQPAWGQMSPQHMVEHLVGSWRISNGRARVKAVLPKEAIQERKVFLLSDNPYPKNLKNPTFSKGLPPLRKRTLAEAVDQLEDEIHAFFAYHKAHPDAIETHPIFGDLTSEEWLRFQAKHMGHHMAQFGITI